MDIGELSWILLRRWYVVLVGLIVTAAGAAYVLQSVPPQYTAASSVLVYRPTSVVGTDGNPFVALGGLEAARDVTLRAINDPSVIADVSENGRQELEVVADGQSSAPIISITVTGPTPAEALRTQARVLDLVPKTLSSLQSDLDVAKPAQVASLVLSQTSIPETSRKSQLRVLIAVVAAGLVLTILVAVVVDRLRRRRQDRSARSQALSGSSAHESGVAPDVVRGASDSTRAPMMS